MSSPSHKADSSLNNLPESNAAKMTNNATSSDFIDTNKTKEKLIPTGSEKTNVEQNTPIDKHGDSWGGGIPGRNKQTY